MSERIERLSQLNERAVVMTSQLGVPTTSLLSGSDGIDQVQLLEFNWDVPVLNRDVAAIISPDDFDEGVFAKWRTADIPMMFISGFLGTLSSVMLREYFAGLHDKNGSKKTINGGHSGENADWVPGYKQPGGIGHRWNHGHDLLNPFEIDWDQYKDIARESGTKLPVWLKATFYWIRHLYQDSFSKEGLPLPGHSLFREWLDAAKNREVLQYLGTIKARDCVGTAVTNTIMAAYVFGTEGNVKRVFYEPNYRGFSLMAGANLVNLLLGLLAPAKGKDDPTSLNWSTIPIIGYYTFQLIKLERKVREELGQRDGTLSSNAQNLETNFETILQNNSLIDAFGEQLVTFECETEDFYIQTMKHRSHVKQKILN